MSAAAPWSVTSRIVDRTVNPNIAIVKVLVSKLRYNGEPVATLEGTLSSVSRVALAKDYNRRGVTLVEHKKCFADLTTTARQNLSIKRAASSCGPEFQDDEPTLPLNENQ